MTQPSQSSRIPKFYKLSIAERRQLLGLRVELTDEDLLALEAGGLDPATADRVVENVVGVYALPFGLGLNWYLNSVVRVMFDVSRVHIDRLSPNAAAYSTPTGAQIGQSFTTIAVRTQAAF